jgi:hypothetical protein
MDFDMMRAGANRIGQAADAFEQGFRQVGGISPLAAPQPLATELLGRFVEALSGALRVAQGELTQHSTALTATVDSYQRAEEVLGHWNVPGWSA